MTRAPRAGRASGTPSATPIGCVCRPGAGRLRSDNVVVLRRQERRRGPRAIAGLTPACSRPRRVGTARCSSSTTRVTREPRGSSWARPGSVRGAARVDQCQRSRHKVAIVDACDAAVSRRPRAPPSRPRSTSRFPPTRWKAPPSSPPVRPERQHRKARRSAAASSPTISSSGCEAPRRGRDGRSPWPRPSVHVDPDHLRHGRDGGRPAAPDLRHPDERPRRRCPRRPAAGGGDAAAAGRRQRDVHRAGPKNLLAEIPGSKETLALALPAGRYTVERRTPSGMPRPKSIWSARTSARYRCSRRAATSARGRRRSAPLVASPGAGSRWTPAARFGFAPAVRAGVRRSSRDLGSGSTRRSRGRTSPTTGCGIRSGGVGAAALVMPLLDGTGFSKRAARRDTRSRLIGVAGASYTGGGPIAGGVLQATTRLEAFAWGWISKPRRAFSGE